MQIPGLNRPCVKSVLSGHIFLFPVPSSQCELQQGEPKPTPGAQLSPPIRLDLVNSAAVELQTNTKFALEVQCSSSPSWDFVFKSI